MSSTYNDDAKELKFMETLNAIKIVSNAVLLGIQKSLNEYGEKNSIPPSIRNMFMKTVQAGGQQFIYSLNGVKNISQLKDFSSKTLNDLNSNINNTDYIVHRINPKDLNITYIGGALNDRVSNLSPIKKIQTETRAFRNRRQLNSLLDEITKELGDTRTTKIFKYVLTTYLKGYIEKMDTEDVKKIKKTVLKYIKLLKSNDASKYPMIMDELKNDLMTSQKIRQIKDRAIEESKKIGITDVEELKRVATEKAKAMLADLKSKSVLPKLGTAYAAAKSNIPTPIGEKMKQIEGLGSKKMEELNEMMQNEPEDDDSGIVSTIASSYFNNLLNITKAIVKKIVMVTDFFIANILDLATNGALNMPLSELTQNTNARILVLAAYLRNLSNSPEQLEAIREISEVFSKIGIEFVDGITPSIEKMTDKLINTLKQSASQAAGGAMKTFVAISASIIAEVPGVGGIVDLIISLAIGFNSVMKVFRTFTENNADVVVEGAQATKKSIDVLSRGKEELTNSINKLLPPANLYNAVGGSRVSNKRYRISTIKNRINTSISNFNNINTSNYDLYIKPYNRYYKYTRKVFNL